MLENIETLSKRIHDFECINWNMLKGYDRFIDRVSLQEGNTYAIKVTSKDETLSLLDRLYTLESSVKALEQNAWQENQTLRKAVVERFQNIEKFIEIYEQG